MSKLTTKGRKALKSSQFALPGRRAFPLTDPSHDRDAIRMAAYSEKKGNISRGTEASIDAKARRKLGIMSKVGK